MSNKLLLNIKNTGFFSPENLFFRSHMPLSTVFLLESRKRLLFFFSGPVCGWKDFPLQHFAFYLEFLICTFFLNLLIAAQFF